MLLKNRDKRRSGTGATDEFNTLSQDVTGIWPLWIVTLTRSAAVPPRFWSLKFLNNTFIDRSSAPSKSHKNLLATNYRASNFAGGSVVLMAQSRILLNIHLFSIKIFLYPRATHPSVQFDPPPKAIGPKLSWSECILHSKANYSKVLNSKFNHNLEHDAKSIYDCPAGQQKLNNSMLKHLN
jgi:hypothetical protein